MMDTSATRLWRACRLVCACACATWLTSLPLAASGQDVRTMSGLAPFVIVGDGIAEPLGGMPGDATRGRGIVANRQLSLCLLCHTGPLPEERFQGNLAPDLAGAGQRWSAAQLRLRLVDSRLLKPDSIMPAYHHTTDLTRVAASWQARPILSAQQVEDVVAFLLTLKD